MHFTTDELLIVKTVPYTTVVWAGEIHILSSRSLESGAELVSEKQCSKPSMTDRKTPQISLNPT